MFLGELVVILAVPALLLKALAESSIGELINSEYMLAYLLGAFVVISVGAL